LVQVERSSPSNYIFSLTQLLFNATDTNRSQYHHGERIPRSRWQVSQTHHPPPTNHPPGAANIGPDTNTYVDGEITREGPVGNQGDGSYSAGRGGAGNIDHEAGTAKHGAPHDSDIVPETATRIAKEESHHVGRGGAGNEQHAHAKKEEHKKDGGGFVEKIKGMFSSKK
jgi:hypothetical protein